MAKKKSEPREELGFSALNDMLSAFSPEGGILDECEFARIDEWISTGSYILNAAMSGTLFGGMPNRRSITFAGEEGSGKTYLALSIARIAQQMNYFPIIYDSEGGIDVEFVKKLGVDPKKMRIENVTTIEEFATLTAKLNETYSGLRKEGKKPPKVMVILDSLGNLSSTKEKEDTTSGSGKRDMTKQQAIRRTFRVIGTEFAKNAIPFIINNHVYEKVGSYIPGKEVSGGGGIKYNSSVIFMLTKSKLTDKDSEEHVKNKGIEATRIGIVVTVTPIKQRFAKPIKVQIHIPFYKRPNPFVGLEKFVSWESCGIVRGKALSEKEYEKLTPGEQSKCYSFVTKAKRNVSAKEWGKMDEKTQKLCVEIDSGGKTPKYELEEDTKFYAYPKDTARSLVCRHLGGEIPIKELYTEKVFTQEILKELDENIIKPTFMLPTIESLDDLAEVTAELEDVEMADTNVDDEDIKITI